MCIDREKGLLTLKACCSVKITLKACLFLQLSLVMLNHKKLSGPGLSWFPFALFFPFFSFMVFETGLSISLEWMLFLWLLDHSL